MKPGGRSRSAHPGLLQRAGRNEPRDHFGQLFFAAGAAAMRSMLLGLSPLGPVSFLSVGALLLLVVVLAALAPALRASGIQPVQALRGVPL